MNNKGFAITTILYGVLILFLMLLVSMLGILSTYKDRLSLLIDGNNGARDIINRTGSDTIVAQPEAPVLDPGMIPVTIANDGTVTTIEENDPNWYNYNNKEWANVVLVDSDSRSSYLNTTDKVVEQTDILAYYVWIPRYKYKIWTTDAKKTTSPQEIDIVFESKNAPVSNGIIVGSYMTHPAFIWDDKTIAGIWVGKFEPSPDPESECYTNPSSGNCNNTEQLPRIVPNVSSLRFQYIGNQFKTSLKFANGTMSNTDGIVTFTTDENNIYGLNTETNTTNSHMMKNSEWGAVAYLSHSKYGINTEIKINSSSSYITGYGSSATYKYGSSTTYPQSTTGNISGIFDISGGAWEYVMGNYGNKSNTYFPTLPESKYYDVYLSSQFTGTYDTNTSLCTLATCGGDALYETKGWYRDYNSFVGSSNAWFGRGGSYFSGTNGGAYDFGSNTGGVYSNNSWRLVLMVEY